MRSINTEELDKIIVGRVEPHIYAFTTEQVPNYLKIGDTFRPVSVRLQEWRTYFPHLKQQYEHIAKTDNGKYFRDFAVHKYLEEIKQLHRLAPNEIKDLSYYSREFFQHATNKDIDDAIFDIEDYASQTEQTRYQFYTEDRLPEESHWKPTESYDLRPNQKKTVEAFMKARKNGRKKLLMYAVMRFGKSFTSMCCAKKMGAKVVLIVSAKADVRTEWQKTVESHTSFEQYVFLNRESLLKDAQAITNNLKKDKRVVVCLTLQDLMGDEIKEQHKDLFKQHIDLLIVDETHYGARAQEYGEILRASGLKQKSIDNELKDADKDLDYLNEGIQTVAKSLDVDMTLHLSGTPYRILMGGEFENEDIIAFYQFTDIIKDKEDWDNEHKEDIEKEIVNPDTQKPYQDWDNPYYGFPQMVRFAFSPSESARKYIEQLKDQGKTAALNELFKPKSISKDSKKLYRRFDNEKEVLDLLHVIDGSKEEIGLFSFLDYDKLKEGKMCHHMVFVLPFCASCDAMEILLKENKDTFKNLSQYEIINIAGHDAIKGENDEIIRRIKDFEQKGKKTISLTVNKMLTGSTIPEWDTMLFLKDVASPQEYDQAIFRIQNQHIKTYTYDKKVIKHDMKPQTLLVDFDVNRMFRMQEQKALIYNINTEERGNNELEERLKKELEISPIILLNKDKLREATPTDIIDAVREYSASRSVAEEARDVPFDYGLLKVEAIKQMLTDEADIDAKKGIEKPATKGNGEDYNVGDEEGTIDNPKDQTTSSTTDSGEEGETINWVKKYATYCARMLFYAFLTDSKVCSLADILADIAQSKENAQIANNVGLNEEILILFSRHLDPRSLNILDYKIKNINDQSRDTTNSPVDRVEKALTRFGRLSTSEIVTPSHIADDMVALLPEKDISEKTKFLDIASKEGEFACALYKHFLPVIGEAIKKNIYSLPTSKLTYEFTRKVYKLLGMPIENVIAEFNSYDLIQSTNKEQFIEQLNNMKIDVVIGNPPYQKEGISTRKTPIYNYFYDVAFDLANKVSLITPARFLFRAGQTPKEWMDKILSDQHVKVVKYYDNPSAVFPDVEIKGGVAITYRDVKSNYGGIQVFTAHDKVGTILSKVREVDNLTDNLSIIIASQGLYRFSEIALNENPIILEKQGKGTATKITSRSTNVLPTIFLAEKPKDEYQYIRFLCRSNNKREYRWIRRDYLVQNEYIDSYNVLISEANGTGVIGETLSTPLIIEPQIGHADTFISIGTFDTQQDANNCLKYIKTKFTRTLLSTLKATQHNSKDTWANIPLQDFTANSDIDWSKSVADIDQQLYKKYHLSPDEVAFIESMIKPM